MEDILKVMYATQNGTNPMSQRKLRLFICACCRRIWSVLSDDNKRLVERAELHADGLVVNLINDMNVYSLPCLVRGAILDVITIDDTFAAAYSCRTIAYAHGWRRSEKEEKELIALWRHISG